MVALLLITSGIAKYCGSVDMSENTITGACSTAEIALGMQSPRTPSKKPLCKLPCHNYFEILSQERQRSWCGFQAILGQKHFVSVMQVQVVLFSPILTNHCVAVLSILVATEEKKQFPSGVISFNARPFACRFL